MSAFVIPGRATDLGFTRDRQFMMPKSAIADLGGANPESRNEFDTCIWIPGPLALRASRNDGRAA
jgi:hypothetical protein